MLRPVELLRGGMKFGNAKFSYVIAGMATAELSHAKQAVLAEMDFGLPLKFVRVLQLSPKPLSMHYPWQRLHFRLLFTCCDLV